MRGKSAGTGMAAAVLIAVTDRPEPGLILTLRPETMRRHAGQIAFPGGRVDPEDADEIAAALREAQEEVALPPSAVEIVGTMGLYQTGTGFDIVPVLGVIAPDLVLVPHDAEVAAVFEVPLNFVLDPANLVEQHATIDGIERRYLQITWGERRIWGATAAMLANLAARLR
ncbi:CoA pyrophosphatase [Sphingomonas paeninsulae]|jgi:8-oxo-dGTP pyrophosphatase MutT (NUDIX family)|uniref:CoA pyrophosphatase n=1 Tax=Sphingomonas paeninsulae TaxID=2319844 RepID=A0A494TQW5_SPHPE|nr:CoA pyrophosphatase [Sphingomonas paeninsulae]AYJ87858.1 CoA pyrophosphatase [Sphingomonas paeninsulae]